MFGLRGTEVFQIIVLLVLCHVGRNGPSIRSAETCNRHSSAIVRHVVFTRLQPVLDRYRVSMPEDCPFHPARDVLVWPQRDFRSITDVWRCPVCGKSFFGEENLNEHFHAHTGNREGTRHVKRHIPEGDRVCLGTFCDIMRCDVIERQWAEALKPRTIPHEAVAPKLKNDCDPQAMASLESRCKVVMQQCTIGLLNELSVKEYKDVGGELYRNICSYLTCERYWEGDPHDTRTVSPFVATIVGFLLASGFFGCYWLVWIAFDNSPPPENSLLEKLSNGTTIRKVISNVTVSRERSAPLVNTGSMTTSHRCGDRGQRNDYSQRDAAAPPGTSEALTRRRHSQYHRSTTFDHVSQHASQLPPVPATQQPFQQQIRPPQQQQLGSVFHYERPLRSPIEKTSEDFPSLSFKQPMLQHKDYATAPVVSSSEGCLRKSRLSDLDHEDFNEHLLYYPLDNQASFVQHQTPPSNSYAQHLQYIPQRGVDAAALYELGHSQSHYEHNRTVDRR